MVCNWVTIHPLAPSAMDLANRNNEILKFVDMIRSRFHTENAQELQGCTPPELPIGPLKRRRYWECH